MSARGVNIHATCLRLARAGLPFRAPANAGVLIRGESGTGKSDLALRLIAAGAELVSDDRTELFVRHGRLHARPPAMLAGLMEIRGVGIVDVPYTEEVRVVLVVDLKEAVVRMPSAAVYRPPQSLGLPRSDRPALLRLVAYEASAPAKVTAAVAAISRGTVRAIVKAQ